MNAFETEENEQSYRKNSDVLKHTLMSLIIVATSKTSDDYAWTSAKKLLGELKGKYSFLGSIKIGNISKINYVIDDICIDSNFDKIKPMDVGMAIQDIIDLLKKYLGKKAGYFFIQEFKEVLGEEYYQIIKRMGVDLRLVELQNEMSGIKIDEYRIKDSGSSNIAFVEKIK
jgi:hypothetical protein